MRRTLTFISVFALMMSMLALPASAETNRIYWEGHGDEHIEGCETGYHWILAPGGGTTTTPLFYSSLDDGEEMYRMSANAGDKAAWHYDSGLVDTEEGVTPYAEFEGTPHPQVKLIISHCLDDEDAPIDPTGTVSVEKNVETSFDREHEWDIDKVVETENEHELDDTPKIWLYTDGSGDETATWTIDVTYLGAKDINGSVTGEIFVGNGGPYAAVEVDSVEDVITQEIEGVDVDTPAEVTCYLDDEEIEDADWPVRLEVGEELYCTYEAEDLEVVDGTNTATAEGTFLYSELDHTEFNQPEPFVDDPFTESATEDVEFGDEPENELYETVNVKDISDLFGDVDLGTVTAPNDATFDYDKDFAYADYGDANCGSHQYDNTATIVETDQSADATLKVNVQCLDWESAWAMGTGDDVDAKPFCDNGFSNWGWTNEISRDYEGSWPLYAGAAQCDPSKGTLVGTFSVTHDGDGFEYEFNIDDGLFSEGGAVYADTGMFPLLRNGNPTTAPGQYYIADPLVDPIHVIAHINVGIPEEGFGPE
jgi:hypothetical protein